MTWVTDNRLHRDEADPCEASAAQDHHRTLRCEDCDARRMSRMTLDAVDGAYREGLVTQDDFEAYGYVFETLSPYQGTPAVPDHPDVRRIARKLFRVRAFEVPAALAE